MRKLIKSVIGVMVLVAVVSGCGIQAIPRQYNEVDAAWAEVMNQYKRRADLVPNLVNVVKGYATHERETLQGVVEARAKASQTNLSLKDLNPQTLKNFQDSQGALTQALSRLLLVVERYPNLKADQNFRDLQVQLEGTENRITIARRRYIETVKDFNNYVTVIPYSWTNTLFYHYDKKPQFTVEDAEKMQTPPEVKF